MQQDCIQFAAQFVVVTVNHGDGRLQALDIALQSLDFVRRCVAHGFLNLRRSQEQATAWQGAGSGGGRLFLFAFCVHLRGRIILKIRSRINYCLLLLLFFNIIITLGATFVQAALRAHELFEQQFVCRR